MRFSFVRLVLIAAICVVQTSPVVLYASQAPPLQASKSINNVRSSFAGAPLHRSYNQDSGIADSSFEVQKLAEGVFAVIRKDPLGLWFNANNVLIINDEDVIVVDSNITSASSREVLGALRKLTTKPVRYVINTHWHEDHIIGNQVYRDAFPGVEFIAHKSTFADLPSVGAANRKQSVEGGGELVKLLRDSVEKNQSLASGELSAEERTAYVHTASVVEQYLAEASKFQIILPTIAVEDRLTLHRGDRVIEVKHLGRAHTAADLVVHLPREGVLITGDLVVHPVPLVGSTSYPAAYGATLEKLLALQPKIIVPGHGPVMRDDSYVKLMVRLLASIKQQTESAVSRGESLEQARKSVNLEEFRKAFAGDSKLKSFLFLHYVTLPAVAAAYRQATTK